MKRLALVHRKVGWKSRFIMEVLNTQTGNHVSLVPCCFSRGEKDESTCVHTPILVGTQKSQLEWNRFLINLSCSSSKSFLRCLERSYFPLENSGSTLQISPSTATVTH